MSGAVIEAPGITGLGGQIRLAARLAMRELRGGLSGFWIFLACIALGTAAIGAVGAISTAITTGIQSQGQDILGGDIRFELNQREASAEEAAFLASLGTVAKSADMRSVVRLAEGDGQALVELKAVDGLYPLYSTFETEPADVAAQIVEAQSEGDVYPLAVQPILLERLDASLGDRVRIGSGQFRLSSLIANEPDALSDGIGLAPRIIMSMEGLRASGLIQPGSLVEHAYKIRLNAGLIPDGVAERARSQFPQAGWSIRSRDNAAPSLASSIERFAQFLTLVGLTALVTGGVGVANAVRAFLDSKRDVIATFKCLGAPGRLIVMVYLFQIMALALVAITAGLLFALVAPFIAKAMLGGLLPLPDGLLIYPGVLGLAALYALLTVLLFSLIPLGRTRDVPASSLFRAHHLSGRQWVRPVYMASALAVAACLGGLIWVSSPEPRLAGLFMGGVVFSFIVLRIMAFAVQWLARRVGRVPSTTLRMAIGNIHRPGALTPSVVLSLGLGLTLLVSLALIDSNLRNQLAGSLPDEAPDFFFVDIQNGIVEDFAATVEAEAGEEGKLIRVPMLRGRVVAIDGTPVEEMEVPAEAEWVLRGDRGLTYARNPPENSTIIGGEWWDADYDGEPLVSFAAEEAGEIGLSVGDTVTVNVLGRNITARIANLRDVEWGSLAINFVMVFSPNTFAGAPHGWLATLSLPPEAEDRSGAILRTVTDRFPAVTSVQVRDALALVNEIVGQLALAIRVAAGIALVAAVLVLAGALAAGNTSRVHDSVVLKTLGATRPVLITSFVLEYALLGLATSLFALAAGGFAAWFVVTQIMTLPWTLSPVIAGATIMLALICTVGFGMIGTWRVLGEKAAPVLRNA